MTGCPTELELDQAFSIGPDLALAAHLERCDACRSLWNETQRAIDLARELPIDLPPTHHVLEQRTALLATWDHEPAKLEQPRVVSSRPRRWWIVPVVAAIAIAATIVVIVAQPSATPAPRPVASHPRRGVVHPHVGAHFTLASQPPDEIVRLSDGVIDIDVDPLAAGERFRVVVGADQVEVHGTSFQVVAVGDQLDAVHVVHGRVEVKRENAAPVILVGGDSWRATVAIITPPPPTPSAPAAPPRVRAPTTIETPRPAPPAPAKIRDPQEVAFVQGWDAMRQGELGQAAAAFSRAIALAPDGALAEDATFWHAVAVARLERTQEAVAAFRSFLDAYPTSARAGEASAMLGWLFVDRHELDEARRRFKAAINDPHPSAQASARKGLEMLDKASEGARSPR